jgi:catechol 2,3-dioxygenase-like lactoylglutathione lyase family enzyme
MFENSTPILRVSDLPASVAWYTDVLGFCVEFHVQGVIASLIRDRARLWLVEGDQGHPGGWVWFGVADVESLCEELKSKNASIRVPPTNYEWAFEMQVSDPDGNVLRFGSEPKKDAPIGEWLDMHERRWAPTPNRSWTRVDGE